MQDLIAFNINSKAHQPPLTMEKRTISSALYSVAFQVLLYLSSCSLNQSFVFHNRAGLGIKTYPAFHSSFPVFRPSRCSSCIIRPAVSEEHAAEVFSLMDADGNGRIDEQELKQVLRMLDIDATNDDVSILFKHLDKDGSKEIDYQEFVAWYASAAASAQRETSVVLDALLRRRTVNEFDTSPVSDIVLRRAVQAAIAAPCHGMTEPWRFIQLGKKTISKIAALNAEGIMKKDPVMAEKKRERWEKIPGWCVVTSAKSDGGLKEQEDYAATCGAVQNFMLAMWAEGVGTKWTTGPVTRTEEFAKLCGINLKKEQVVGCIWYGFASGGLASVPAPKRKKGIDDVLSTRP